MIASRPDGNRCVVEDGIIAGNVYDKYGDSNVLTRAIMRSFFRQMDELADLSGAVDVHEVGCGEGHLTRRFLKRGYRARGSDFSAGILDVARDYSRFEGVEGSFSTRSVYELNPEVDSADLVICSEVFEHLEQPDRALDSIARVASPYLLASVPREPLWRFLNMLRGRYIGSLGNTPGHVQHWSRTGFITFLARRFEILKIRDPLPWTIVLCRVP